MDQTTADHDPPKPLVAAYELGRALRKLHFVAAQAWIGLAETGGDLGEEFDSLRGLVRRAVLCDNRDEAQVLVDSYRADLFQILRAEWHAESLNEYKSELPNKIQQGDLAIPARHEHRRFFGPLDEFVSRIREALGQYLDVTGRCSLAFGYCVESGIFYAQLVPQASQITSSLERAQIQDLFGTAVPATPQVDDPMVHLQPSDGIPTLSSWAADLRERWLELQISNEPLDVTASLDASTSARDTFVRFAEATDHSFRVAVDDHARSSFDELAVPPAPGYLDLIVDKKRRTVTRVGREEHIVYFTSKLKWNIISLFVRNKDILTSRDQLISVWEHSNCSPDPQPGTVDTEINKIKRSLGPLGVTLRNTRRLGWVLEDNEQQR